MTEEWIIAEIEGFVHKYNSLYKERNLKWGELKKLTEFKFLLDDFIELSDLDPIDKINLVRFGVCISDKVRFDNIIFYYSSFHYFYNKIAYNDIYEDISQLVYQMNIQINIVRIQIKNLMITGCSEDNYFFDSRGKELVSALEIMFYKGEKKNVNYNSVLYLLLNYEQALLEYINSGDKHYFDSVIELIKRCMNLVEKYYKNFTQLQKSVQTNIKLRMFIYSVYILYQQLLTKENSDICFDIINEINTSDVITNNIWAIKNIYDIDKNYFIEYFEQHFLNNTQIYDKLYEDSKMVYLRSYLRWMKEKNTNKVRIMKLPTIDKGDDKSWFNIDQYVNGYNDSATMNITDDDISKVESYNDEILRKKIANILKNIDKHTINRESVKAHGVFEIADMELPIRNESFGSTYYICIPVKSGVEITKKVTEDIAYQVIRPFTYFGNKAIVIFISAKEATESFYNYVKRAKANLNFDIYVIAGKELVKLLKFNNQIEL